VLVIVHYFSHQAKGAVIADRLFCIRVDDKQTLKKEEEWSDELKQKFKDTTKAMRDPEFSEQMIIKSHERNRRNRARNIALFAAATCAMALINFNH
jgi:Flp pilus assembly protein TadB